MISLPFLILFVLFFINVVALKFEVFEKRLLFFFNIFLASVLFAIFMKVTGSFDFVFFVVPSDSLVSAVVVALCCLVSFCTIDYKDKDSSLHAVLIAMYMFFNFAILSNPKIEYLIVFGAFLTLTDSICMLGQSKIVKKILRDFFLRSLWIILISVFGLVLFSMSTVRDVDGLILIQNHKLYAVSLIVFFFYLILKIAPTPFHFVFYKTNSLSSPSTSFLSILMSRIILVPYLVIEIHSLLENLIPDLQSAILNILLMFSLFSIVFTYFKLIRLKNTLRTTNYIYLFNSHLIFFSIMLVDAPSVEKMISIYLALVAPYLTITLIEWLIINPVDYLNRTKGLVTQFPLMGIIYVSSILFLWGLPASMVYDFKIFAYEKAFWSMNPYLIVLLMMFSFSIGIGAVRTLVHVSSYSDGRIALKESVPLKVSCLLIFALNIFLNLVNWYDFG